MLYDISGRKQTPYFRIVGDGVTDDTYALQFTIDNADTIAIPSNMVIRLTNTVNIDISKLRIFDGCGCTIIVDGSFSAFRIVGSCQGTADPSTQTETAIEDESGFIFQNVKIIGKNKYNSQSFNTSVGITVEACFNTTIQNCYITQVNDGISVVNRNRNIIIANNHIYNLSNCGIIYHDTVNLHQCNIIGNMIQYCRYPIMIDGSSQIANFQITGNDIEISTYPAISFLDQRCIYINSGDVNSGQLSEIVITGNTIQGHSKSNCIIEIKGGTNRWVRFLSIVGNHISNTKQTLVNLEKVKDVSISNNTFFTDNSLSSSYAIDLKNCMAVSVNGNGITDMGYLVKTSNGTKAVSVTGNASNTFANKTLEKVEAIDSIIEQGNAVEQLT